jgi:hypothetical protein
MAVALAYPTNLKDILTKTALRLPDNLDIDNLVKETQEALKTK